MYCFNCGKPIEEGARFCTNCGAPVKAAPETINESLLGQQEGTEQSIPEEPVVAEPKYEYTQKAEETPAAPKKSKTKKVLLIVGIVVAALIITVVGAFFLLKKVFQRVDGIINVVSVSDDQYIDTVRNGYLPKYDYCTVGEAFDAFFLDPEWKYFQAEDGDHVVQFEGQCYYLDELTDFLIQFIVKGDNFEVYALEIDGNVQNQVVETAVIEKIFSDAELYGITEQETTAVKTNKEDALEDAKFFLEYFGYSYSGLIEQLKYDGYTDEAATYAADNCGADWNEQAAKSASVYKEYTEFSKDEVKSFLEYEGFTDEQIAYGLAAVGY